MKMAAAVKALFCLLCILQMNRAQKPSDESIHMSFMLLLMRPQFLISLLLLGLTVSLSGAIYLWVLRYVCIGCCQPVAIGVEPEALDGMV